MKVGDKVYVKFTPSPPVPPYFLPGEVFHISDDGRRAFVDIHHAGAIGFDIATGKSDRGYWAEIDTVPYSERAFMLNEYWEGKRAK